MTYNVFSQNLRVFLSDLIYDNYTVAGGQIEQRNPFMAKRTAIRENANLHLIYLHFETAFVSDPNLRELYCKQISLFSSWKTYSLH